jgi:hypothetical protein
MIGCCDHGTRVSGVSASSFQTTRPASAGSLRLAAGPVVLGHPRRRFRWAHVFGEAALGKAGTAFAERACVRHDQLPNWTAAPV